MAIDTPLKRKGAINIGIPGAYLMPIPDGIIDKYNRRQMTDSYPIEPTTLGRTCWVQDRDSSMSWAQDQDLSQTWVQDRDSSMSWVQDQDLSQTWVQDMRSSQDWKKDVETDECE